MKRITVLLLCLSALSCCTERRISRELKTFMGETITVPSDLVRIVDGKTSVCGQMPAVPVMVSMQFVPDIASGRYSEYL